MSEVLLLGISHKTAPVAVRERLALRPSAAAGSSSRTSSTSPSIREAVVISTCNRTELYLVVSDPVEAESAALGALASRAGIRPTELAEVVYAPRNCDAARQLFRVSSGLESMIVGEAEVQGQVRRALRGRGRRRAPTGRSSTGCSTPRCAPAGACAPRPRSAPAARRSPRSPSTSPATCSATSPTATS